VIKNLAIRQPQPIQINKLIAYLNKPALWQRRLQVARAVVRGAIVPQLSLRGLGSQPTAARPETPKKFIIDALLLARIELGDARLNFTPWPAPGV